MSELELGLAHGPRLLAALLLFLGVAWPAHAVASAVLPAAPTSIRASATVIIAWWGLSALFHLSAVLGLFRLEVAMPLCLLVAWLVDRRLGKGARASLVADREALGRWWREIGALTRFGVALFLAVLGFRLLRGLVSPPLAWDSLTYHLVHPARWVGAGSHVRELAPDNWGFYEYFPIGVEILWGWAMLPMHGDALLAPAGVLLLLAVGLAAYASARVLGVGAARATAVALALASTPAVFSFVTSGYVDNGVLAAMGLGSVFLLRQDVHPQRANIVFAAAAFGLCASAKLPAVLILASALLALAFQVLRSEKTWRERLQSLAWMGAAASICLPHLIRTTVATGSPIYPFALELAGKTVLPGNPQFLRFHDLEWMGALPSSASPWRLAGQMLGLLPNWRFDLGPGSLVMAVLGLVGLARMFRNPGSRLGAGFLLTQLVIMLAIASSDSAAVTRTFFWHISGRLFTVGLFAVAVPAATVSGPGLGIFWLAAAALSLLLGQPWRVSPSELRGIGALAAIIACLAFALRFVLGLRETGWQRRGRLLIALALVAGLGAGIGWIRVGLRSAIYAEAARGEASELNVLHPRFASAWPIWRELDAQPGRRIAVATGWAGVVHNSYRYPLFGVRLQHSLHYVPTTRSGEIFDTEPALGKARPEGHFVSWLQRLVDSEIDLLVTLAPDVTQESVWARAHPQVFELLAQSDSGSSRAWRMRRAAAERLLAVQPE